MMQLTLTGEVLKQAGLNRWAIFKQVRYLKGAWIERLIEVN